jgi:hypothetical protein
MTRHAPLAFFLVGGAAASAQSMVVQDSARQCAAGSIRPVVGHDEGTAA